MVREARAQPGSEPVLAGRCGPLPAAAAAAAAFLPDGQTEREGEPERSTGGGAGLAEPTGPSSCREPRRQRARSGSGSLRRGSERVRGRLRLSRGWSGGGCSERRKGAAGGRLRKRPLAGAVVGGNSRPANPAWRVPGATRRHMCLGGETTEPGSRRAVPSAFGADSGCPGGSAGRHLCGGTARETRGDGAGEGVQVAPKERRPQAVTFRNGF